MKKLVPSDPVHGPASQSAGEGELELDDLLDKVEEKQANKKSEGSTEQRDPIDDFRIKMRQEYIPLFDKLAHKYAGKGVSMELDVDEFLGGGSSIKMRFVYGDLSMELDGTVMRGGVAFYIIRAVGRVKGAVVSGPMLRIRNLGADDFRDFVVGHLSQLIKDALRQS